MNNVRLITVVCQKEFYPLVPVLVLKFDRNVNFQFFAFVTFYLGIVERTFYPSLLEKWSHNKISGTVGAKGG
jgi:hypothetical protein